MNLWLDDVRDPKDPKIQSKFYAEGNEFWVKTADQAIHYLSQDNIVSVSLDFDLGPGCGTGLEVAEWMERHMTYKVVWSVHSTNREMRWKMASCLKRMDERLSKN